MSCLGAPPSRGKRARCEEGSPEESVEFSVVGFSATRHPGAAPEEQLQSWAGDLCVTVDRFDVRNLLPQWAPPPAQRRWSSLTEEPAALLEQERFGDLRAREEADACDAEEARKQASLCFAPPLPPEVDAPEVPPPPPPSEPYQPSFALPPQFSLPGALPATRREAAVLSRTAAFVRTSGAQSEIVLRVRHSGNACFAFLEPQHRLHAFYVHLRNADPEARQRAARASLQLLSDYGEEEEEEEEPAATIEQPTDVVPEAADAPPPEERAPEPLASRAELPVEMAAAMDRVVWAALRGGAEGEAALRRRPPPGGHTAALDFLNPWSPLNVHFLARLAAARAHAQPQPSAPAAAPPPARVRRARWDVQPPHAPEEEQAPHPPPPEHAEQPEAQQALCAEDERRLERLRKAREFSAQRAATARATAVSAHASLASSHRAALMALTAEDNDHLLPEEESVAVVLPPASALLKPKLISRNGAAHAPSLADAHTAALTAATRAREAKARGARSQFVQPAGAGGPQQPPPAAPML